MPETMTQHTLRRDFVGECEWDRRLAAIPDNNLVDPSIVPLLVEWAKKVAASFGSGYREMIESEEATASAEKDLATPHTLEMQQHIVAIEREFASAPPGSVLGGILMAFAYLLAIASEAYLNRGVLPWILGVTGIGLWALMIGPAFILPSVLEGICHPMLEATSRWGKIVRTSLYSVTGVLILATVALIGLCRGAVSHIRSGKDMTLWQAQTVDMTLLVLGVCVAVCAVIAAFSSRLELKRAMHVKRLEASLRDAEDGLRTAREVEAAAISKLATAKKRLEMIEGLSRSYEEEFLADRLANLGDRLARIKTSTEVTQMVEWAEKLAVFQSLGLGWGTDKPIPFAVNPTKAAPEVLAAQLSGPTAHRQRFSA